MNGGLLLSNRRLWLFIPVSSHLVFYVKPPGLTPNYPGYPGAWVPLDPSTMDS